ncbi:hypothetical protein [Streptosporangium roseum]|uniref:hypothetical protein n=1 Tax=Streptosporangium roseum TaxID=2001 RepID=UPI0004CCCF5B|nr:hypothetical protein [Streptosporangium roseum]
MRTGPLEEARTTTAQLRALAEQPHNVDDEAVTACPARAEPTLTEALRTDGAVSMDARLTPAQRQRACLIFAARAAASWGVCSMIPFSAIVVERAAIIRTGQARSAASAASSSRRPSGRIGPDFGATAFGT